ncbi:hypothetical protein Naga_100640g3 [Nannochloropsis gaditana]|uniref:Uncharacterized protein n=1 Tax=Nannochloropsis gaditana TaxID=72520 RepID=W7TKR5_9STRA|nr:hypothetical protein Naga_100640g3 [Nannochloropsis gaditana]
MRSRKRYVLTALFEDTQKESQRAYSRYMEQWTFSLPGASYRPDVWLGKNSPQEQSGNFILTRMYEESSQERLMPRWQPKILGGTVAARERQSKGKKLFR